MLKEIIDKLKNYSVRFDSPALKQILLYDETHSDVLKEIIKKDFNVIKVRNKKEIHFWIVLRQIIFFDFSFLTYCKNYIKYSAPKIVITFIDNDMKFYELKKKF